MCEQPNLINGYEVSCRECGQCLSTYKNTWVSRCVAQLATARHSYAFTLTYADVDGEAPLGAKVFRYRDVQDFLKRLRAAAFYKWEQNIELCYVIVGEKGTRFGRCHYHGVLFSSHPIQQIGDFTGPNSTGFAFKRRLNWSTWGHGFVEFQLADRDGIAYVLKYILKGKMNAKKSRGQRREGKTEWLASSYLWCSKVPPVGAVWLWLKLKKMVSLGICPSNLRIRVPNGGDWYVTGNLQKEMCLFLREQNTIYKAERGRDLAGFKSLVNSVKTEIELAQTGELVHRKPWEWLINGEETETQPTNDPEGQQRLFDQFQSELNKQQQRSTAIYRARKTVGRCGGIKPCKRCQNTLGKFACADLQTEYQLRFEDWKRRFPKGPNESGKHYEKRFKRWWWTRLKISRGCQLSHLHEIRSDFERLVPLEKSRPFERFKRAIGRTL